MAQATISFGRVTGLPPLQTPLFPRKAVKPLLNETYINPVMLAMSQQANSLWLFPVALPC